MAPLSSDRSGLSILGVMNVHSVGADRDMTVQKAYAQTGPGLVPWDAVDTLLKTYEVVGGRLDQLLAKPGLSSLRPLLQDRDAPGLARGPFARLASTCTIAFHERACLRDRVRPLSTHYFRYLATMLLACPCLRTAVMLAEGFQEMMLEGRGCLRLDISGDTAELVLDLGNRDRDTPNLLVTLYALASFHRLLGWLIRDEIPLRAVMLSFPPETERPAFNALVQFHPRFGQSRTAIHFPASYLDRTVSRSFDELPKLFETFPFDLLPPDYGERRLSDMVRRAMSAALSFGAPIPTMDKLIEVFSMTKTTFRRRLAAESASLLALRDECRMELADKLLRDTGLTVAEIAGRCQYSDAKSFGRAFRSWTGISPDQYRRSPMFRGRL